MEKKVYMVPNPAVPNKVVEINPELCTGCNTCVEGCRADVLMPNPKKGEPPIVLYPDECWYGGCCQAHCPVPGAIKMLHPMHMMVGWKRKDTGEYFRIGMANPPPPNTRPPAY